MENIKQNIKKACSWVQANKKISMAVVIGIIVVYALVT
tara:strand:- start:96 stop:209 length:114 start_codon:yes stop_codon:yes gene_type:complete